jgi:hypothetical protein
LKILIAFIDLYCTCGSFKYLHCSLYSEKKLPTIHKYSSFSSSTETRFYAYNAASNAVLLLAPVALIRGVHRMTASTVRVDLNTNNSGYCDVTEGAKCKDQREEIKTPRMWRYFSGIVFVPAAIKIIH